MSPLVQMVAGLLLAAVAACGTIYGGFLAKSGYDRYAASLTLPNVSFQKLAIFYIQVDENIYQLGAVIKLFNLDNQPHLINGITFDRTSFDMLPRGGYLLKQFFLNQDHAEIIEDNYIKANSEGFYKKLLPIKFEMTILGGAPPEFIFFGQWQLLFGDKRVAVAPYFYTNYDSTISMREWEDILKPTSKVNLDSLQYRTIPAKRPATGNNYANYLIYNPDRSATIDIYGFSQVPSVKGANGVMTFLRGIGEPPLENGWILLGRTYTEVWTDPKKLTLYNSIYPPGLDGKPRPFGVFAGVEQEMMGH